LQKALDHRVRVKKRRKRGRISQEEGDEGTTGRDDLGREKSDVLSAG